MSRRAGLPLRSVSRPERPSISRHVAPQAYRYGPLGAWLTQVEALDVGAHVAAGKGAQRLAVDGSQALVFAGYVLQDVPDYRGALQSWFAALRTGGHLVIIVPHAFLYERQDALPSRLHPTQNRLYTPASLVREVEEALVPNTYRVRWLGDQDIGYDYALGRTADPIGQHDVALVIQRIQLPDWGLSEPRIIAANGPDVAFEPPQTRIGRTSRAPSARILALKLDHLGDFVMGIPALERLRAAFPDAHLTLVVGSWNESLARGLDIADTILTFDAYPRNSGEEAVDVTGKTALFDQTITGQYDLAIDLRTDPETRFLLRNVAATLKAGLGSKVSFPFLDIFLPFDPLSGHYDHAWTKDIPLGEFEAQGVFARSRFRIDSEGKRAARKEESLLWGPHHRLVPGDYLFEPSIEIDRTHSGLLGYDIALDMRSVVDGMFGDGNDLAVEFSVVDAPAAFEFRILAVENEPVLPFRFYGGRLTKRGAAATLHQSEYLGLLVELVAMRTATLFDEREA